MSINPFFENKESIDLREDMEEKQIAEESIKFDRDIKFAIKKLDIDSATLECSKYCNHHGITSLERTAQAILGYESLAYGTEGFKEIANRVYRGVVYIIRKVCDFFIWIGNLIAKLVRKVFGKADEKKELVQGTNDLDKIAEEIDKLEEKVLGKEIEKEEDKVKEEPEKNGQIGEGMPIPEATDKPGSAPSIGDGTPDEVVDKKLKENKLFKWLSTKANEWKEFKEDYKEYRRIKGDKSRRPKAIENEKMRKWTLKAIHAKREQKLKSIKPDGETNFIIYGAIANSAYLNARVKPMFEVISDSINGLTQFLKKDINEDTRLRTETVKDFKGKEITIFSPNGVSIKTSEGIVNMLKEFFDPNNANAIAKKKASLWDCGYQETTDEALNATIKKLLSFLTNGISSELYSAAKKLKELADKEHVNTQTIKEGGVDKSAHWQGKPFGDKETKTVKDGFFGHKTKEVDADIDLDLRRKHIETFKNTAKYLADLTLNIKKVDSAVLHTYNKLVRSFVYTDHGFTEQAEIR